MKLFNRFLSLALVFLMAVWPAYAVKYYVRPDGNNANAGTSNTPGGAWGTAAFAFAHAYADGDVIEMRDITEDMGRVTITEDGSAGAANYITFIAPDRDVLLNGTSGIRFNGANFIRLIGFAGTHSSGTPAYEFISFSATASSFIELWENTFTNSYSRNLIGTETTTTVNHDLKFIGNWLSFPGVGDGVGDTALQAYGDNMRIQNNFLEHVVDYIYVGGGSNAVVANNFGGLVLLGDFPSASPSPPHTDFTQLLNSAPITNYYNGYNYLLSNTVAEGHYLIARATASSTIMSNLIFKGNVVARHGYAAFQFGHNQNVAFSRNTLVDTMLAASEQITFLFDDEGTSGTTNGHNMGNIWWSVTPPSTGDIYRYDPNSLVGAWRDYNYATNSGAFDVAEVNGSDTADIAFVDYGGQNYTLQSGSAVRNVLPAITTTSGSGTASTVITVNSNAFHFSPGFGLVNGTYILVDTDIVRVTAMDNGTQQITVTPAITWASGDAIFECTRSGIKFDDAGAYEYLAGGYSISGTYHRVGDAYTATFVDTDLVQRVVFFENGIPLGEDWEPPFTYTRADGTAVVLPKAYPFFASKNLSEVMGYAMAESAPPGTTLRGRATIRGAASAR